MATRTHVLVLNSGSSSLKFALVEPGPGHVARQGLAERLGTPEARVQIRSAGPGAGGGVASGADRDEDQPLPGAGHAEALEQILSHLGAVPPAAVGHRVVHGGEAFSSSVVLDDAAVARIRACNELAPLHNPANVLGIEI